jgi:hypothetical protein
MLSGEAANSNLIALDLTRRALMFLCSFRHHDLSQTMLQLVSFKLYYRDQVSVLFFKQCSISLLSSMEV